MNQVHRLDTCDQDSGTPRRGVLDQLAVYLDGSLILLHGAFVLGDLLRHVVQVVGTVKEALSNGLILLDIEKKINEPTTPSTKG